MENYYKKHFKFIYVDGVRHFYGTGTTKYIFVVKRFHFKEDILFIHAKR
jgi:hypothetical protein